MSARRVTRAVYFPRALERERGGECARSWWSLWIHRDPLLTPQSIMLLLRHRDVCVRACVRAPQVARGYDPPLPQHALLGYVLVGSVAACVISDQKLGVL